VHRFSVAPFPGAIFRDRADAGRRLAERLLHLRAERPVVLGLPRGGVTVAAEVADALGAPLDVALVRKLGVPYQPELAVGAIGEGGVRVVNDEVRRAAAVGEADLALVEARQRTELERQARTFRPGRAPADIAGRTVIVVDDGIATGSTARAACEIARARGATRVVLATPVAPAPTLAHLASVADEIVCVQTPEPFFAIGQWYADFSQVPDDEVVSLLERHRRPGWEAGDRGPPTTPPPAQAKGGRLEAEREKPDVLGANTPEVREDVEIPLGGGVVLPGSLRVPSGATGLVLFAHGSGSSRSSPRNQHVAGRLREGGLGTVLFDLLGPDEARDRTLVFDIDLLGRRLAAATQWAASRPVIGRLPIGAFGASTGAAAALWAAAEPASPIGALVSRGGRPDLTGRRLGAVRCPTLLIVGSLDPVVLELNRQSLDALQCEASLEVVQGATHLFEEPGALEEVARLAVGWFRERLAPRAERTG